MNILIENKEKREKYMKGRLELLNQKVEKKEQDFSKNNYMEWLEDFTEKHPSFSDNDWLYFSEKISIDDNKKVYNLQVLYQQIKLYAQRNCIKPNESGFGYYYYDVIYDGNGYEIGVLIGKKAIYFCNRKPLENNLNCIDMNKVVSENQQLNNNTNSGIKIQKETGLRKTLKR